MNTDLIAAVTSLALKMRMDHPHLRNGQALINALWDIDKDRCKAISCTSADCFYDDSKVNSFWKALENS